MLFFLQLIILGSFGISYEFHSIISLSRDVVFFWGGLCQLGVFLCFLYVFPGDFLGVSFESLVSLVQCRFPATHICEVTELIEQRKQMREQKCQDIQRRFGRRFFSHGRKKILLMATRHLENLPVEGKVVYLIIY